LQFDLSVFDVFTTLSAGGTIVIAPPGFSEDADAIVDFMTEKKVSIIYTVPSAYIRLLNKGGLERGIPSLRLAFYAGEPFPPAYLARVNQALGKTVLWNIYGPTETNIVTYFRVPDDYKGDAPIPIGQAVADTDLFILGPDLMPVAKGEIGEIVVRGGTVFKGYLNDAVLTKERLVQCPWHFYPENFCRTGDLGRIDDAGMIEYHGRMDNMIKTRGYRVEIDEVENALSEIPGVAQSAVVALPHPRFTNTLHAYIQLSDENASSIPEIKIALGRKLPDYMIPFTFDVIDEFPKTSTAKIDRVGLMKLAEKNMRNAASQ
jgi:acyl-coenzyme A synthetase/AMP-(fatty) acid ligase